MAELSSPPNQEAWRSDARSDFFVYQLLRLARLTLDEYFEEDSDGTGYRKWLRRELRKKTGGQAKPLKSWSGNAERSDLNLSALPAENRFTLRLQHKEFRAEVTLGYDIDLETLEAGRVDTFRGDIGRALVDLESWLDELFTQALDDVAFDPADVNAMLRDAGIDPDADNDDDDDDGEPREPRFGLRAEIERMARLVGLETPAGFAPELDEADQDWLDRTPESLLETLPAVVDACRAIPRDEVLLQGLYAVLDQQLELIRYASDRGHDWANDLLNRYQDRLVEIASENALAHDDLFPMVAALGRAKVAVKPELSAAIMGMGPVLPDSMPTEQALDQMIRPLIDEMARQVETPFEVMQALAETASVMPATLRSFLAHELALSKHAVIREAVPLMLLDSDAEVRRSAGQALEQYAESLSSDSLRRAIAVRNWIPEADRAALDQAIRKARAKGIQPTHWPRGPEPSLRCSGVDGSGTQSLVFPARSGKSGIFAGLLLKQGLGVRDAWCHHDVPRREIATMVAEMQRTLPSPEVERGYVDLVVQNAIALGVATGSLPGAGLLDVAEAIGGGDWKDRRLDVHAEAEGMFAQLPPDQRSANAIAASLRRSGGWMDADPLTDSWFEDDAKVRALLDRHRQESVAHAARVLLGGVLAERRALWAERILLTALWARAVRPGQPPALAGAARGMSWCDLLVLAREVLSGRPLHDIPAMAKIAELTVLAAREA